MDFEQIAALREERKTVHERMKALHAQASEEKRDLSAEEQSHWDKMDGEMKRLKTVIEREERLYDQERHLGESQGVIAGRQDTRGHDEPPDDGEGRTEERTQQVVNSEMRQWLLTGLNSRGIPQKQFDLSKALMDSAEARRMRTALREYRAMSTSATAGGDTIPEGFRNILETAMLAFGGMRQSRATILRTASGNDLPMPTADDTSNKGAILAENTKATEQDITTGAVTLNAFKYTSKVIRVSFELLQDSAFDLPTWLAERLGERIGRITNEHFTTGTGSAQPNGMVTASAAGKTGATGQTTSIIADDLIDLEHSVDIAYRQRAEYMMHDSTLKAIKKLKDADDRFLWLPGLAVREPDTILSYRYIVNNDVAQMAASAKSVVFGDLSKYIIRDVMDIMLIRLDEVYAETAQVAFVAFSRHDGDLLDAGTDPVKHYANSAT